MNQTRLDILLCERNLASSREKAQALIMAGAVWADNLCLDKPGLRLASDASIEVRQSLPFVSRGGLKLAHALETFNISVEERVCLDIGASTGGFTDCLLQKGASRVFAVDVGRGQLDYKLQKDERVSSLEKENARFLNMELLKKKHPSAGEITFVCADVSFISLRNIVPALLTTLTGKFEMVLLFKPQFEVGKENIRKGGVVKDAETAKAALESFDGFMRERGLLRTHEAIVSPITGKKSGNTEFLLHYEK